MYNKEGQAIVGLVVVVLITMVVMVSALFASPARADDKVDGVVIGIVATKLFERVLEDINQREGVIYVPGDVDDFPPFKCTSEDKVVCAYERGVYDREHKAYKQAKINAYECGRYGRNCKK